MKRINNLFDRIVDYNNLVIAEHNARKGKTNRHAIKQFDKHRDQLLHQLQYKLINQQYNTSEYTTFTIYEPKERLIYRLPYYPDRIVHHAIMRIMEPIWVNIFIKCTYSCIKGRGIHKALKDTREALKDIDNTQYCLKLDIKKFYPSIDHDILKSIIRKKIKDNRLLNLLDEIIDSAPGVPIGNYLSQFFANLYVTYFDHWIKEVKKIKYYFRYADDIVILHNNKTFLHELYYEIKNYLKSNLKLQLKDNWQVFKVESRGIDFVGYKMYHTHTLLRKNIKQNFCKVTNALNKTQLNYDAYKQKVSSYLGWLKYCDSYNLSNKQLKYKALLDYVKV